MTLLSQYLHIHFQFILHYEFPPILKLYLILSTNENGLFLKLEGRLFTFCFCSLCPIYQFMVHVECHPVVRFHPFFLPLVRACSHTSPKCPSMFELMPFTPSLFFVQRAAALHFSNVKIDPHA